MQEFKFGHTSTNNEPRPVRFSGHTTTEMIKKVLRFVTDNRKLKVRVISKVVNISTERVHNILHNYLNMQKLCARLAPRVLTDQQKLKRANVSQYNLNMFKHNPKEFLRRLVTIVERWIHHYTPETKEQSK